MMTKISIESWKVLLLWKEESLCLRSFREESASSRRLKNHKTLKHTREGPCKTTDKVKKSVSSTIEVSEFQDIVRKCAKICYEDICLTEDTRNLFDPCEFCRQDEVDLWEILRPVLSKFHGDAEIFNCSFYDLLQDDLLPKNLVVVLPWKNILLAEIGDHLLSFLNKSK